MFAECGSSPADIVFLLDSSVSVGTTNFEKQINFVADFAGTFDIASNAVRVGVVTFASVANNEFNLNTFKSRGETINAINNIEYIFGGTRTDLALKYAVENSFSIWAGDRPDVPNILIVITDGKSNEPELTRQEADILHQLGVKVFAIGIGTGVDDTELGHIASAEQYVFKIENFDAFETLKEELQNSACNGMIFSNLTYIFYYNFFSRTCKYIFGKMAMNTLQIC